jgi:hypothetical protein
MSWDARLITPERVFELTRDWPLEYTRELAELSQFEMEGGGDPLPDQWQINMRCGKCGQSCGMLADHTGPLPTSIGDQASGVLRHMVMAHGTSLSGAPSPPDEPMSTPPLTHPVYRNPEVRPEWLG